MTYEENNVVETVSEPTNERQFSVLDSVYAWITLILGYLFCRAFPVKTSTLGGFLLVFTAFVVSFIVFKIRGEKIGVLPTIAAISAVVISATLVITSNNFLGAYAYLYAIVAYMYFIFAATANRTQKGFSNYVLIDFFKAIFVMPFVSFGLVFKALFSGKARGSGKFILKLLLGCGITIIPTAIIFSLLSYDSGFTKLFKNIFDFSVGDFFSQFVSIGFAIPMAMYVFGLYASSTAHKCQNVATVKKCRAFWGKIKIAPIVTILAAVVPILLIYVVFFISQSSYYLSAFTGVLPENLTYAEYAREGFFQLCTVSCINLAIITLISMFMKRNNGKPSVALKILSVIFSVVTLALIATAVSKMVIYIECYGLTQKRVYSTWLMVVIAFVFIFIAIRQFAPKIKVVALSLSVLVVLFGALSLSNVDRLIAKYNVDRYIEGSLEDFDVDATVELGDAAIPELVRLNGYLEEKMQKGDITYEQKGTYYNLTDDLEQSKKTKEDEKKEKEIFSYTLPYIEAQRALSQTK